MNLRLDLAYDGAPFHGFARQPDVPTVQGELEQALSRVVGREVATVCAGRTDAGVHALAQVVSTPDAPDGLDPAAVKRSLNAMLGPRITVHSCVPAPDGFSARHSARSRTYVYAVLEGEPDPFLAPVTWRAPAPLDLAAMNEAAGHLVGPHDFSSFGRVPEGHSPDRVLFELACSRGPGILRVKARANAFIHQMVRSLVGTLVEVGRGDRSPEDMRRVLAARDRHAAGAVAPPHGLCLVAVEYEDGWAVPQRLGPGRPSGDPGSRV